jgi:hypothetical protein
LRFQKAQLTSTQQTVLESPFYAVLNFAWGYRDHNRLQKPPHLRLRHPPYGPHNTWWVRGWADQEQRKMEMYTSLNRPLCMIWEISPWVDGVGDWYSLVAVSPTDPCIYRCVPTNVPERLGPEIRSNMHVSTHFLPSRTDKRIK